MNVGRDCPNCKADIGVWPVFSAGLPNRIKCPHCSVRLQYRDTPWALPLGVTLGILVAGIALIVSGAYRVFFVDMPSSELAIRLTVFSAAVLTAWVPIELGAACFLRKNKELECTAILPLHTSIAPVPPTHGTPEDE